MYAAIIAYAQHLFHVTYLKVQINIKVMNYHDIYATIKKP
jgi:hypothetical protein